MRDVLTQISSSQWTSGTQPAHQRRVAVGPDYNAAHWNHFHLDRGMFTRCQ